jgi:hypothetical protein
MQQNKAHSENVLRFAGGIREVYPLVHTLGRFFKTHGDNCVKLRLDGFKAKTVDDPQ